MVNTGTVDLPPQASRAELLRVFGTEQPPISGRLLRAGRLSCRLEHGAVRAVLWDDDELIRGVSYLLRDSNWGTAPMEVTHLHVEESPQHFAASFDLLFTLPEGALRAQASLVGKSSGGLTFQVRATPDVEMGCNRCGFVVLHPAHVAGADLRVTHVDGTIEDTQFPRTISPGQVVFGIRNLSHVVRPGVSADCTVTADLPHDALGKFEMEDQRNWSDASFKTYVSSLLDTWPYRLPAQKTLCQSVEIQVHDRRIGLPRLDDGVAAGCIDVGEALDIRLPPIGLGVPLQLVALTDQERGCVVAMRPAWLQAEVDLGDGASARTQLECLQALALACGAKVQLDVLCESGQMPAAIAQELARICQAMGLQPHALRACPKVYLKSYQPTDTWPQGPSLEEYAQALAGAFPGVHMGGGMLTNFTELNRKRQSSAGIQFIGHSTSPLVHAADDASVMQTHESLQHIAYSVRSIWPELGYRLGPVTLGMHRNPYGEKTADNPRRERVAMAADDPRHQGSFGAAWMVGYASAVLEAGLELLSLSHSHGVNGPLHRDGLAQRPSAGTCVPSWRVQTLLNDAAGCTAYRVKGLPRHVSGMAWLSTSFTPHLLLANLSEQVHTLQVRGIWSASDLSGPCPMTALRQWQEFDTLPATEEGGASQLALKPYQTVVLRTALV